MKRIWELDWDEHSVVTDVMRRLHKAMAVDLGGVCPVPPVEMLNAILIAYNLGKDNKEQEIADGGYPRFMVRP